MPLFFTSFAGLSSEMNKMLVQERPYVQVLYFITDYTSQARMGLPCWFYKMGTAEYGLQLD